jgi:hypothetical protein
METKKDACQSKISSTSPRASWVFEAWDGEDDLKSDDLTAARFQKSISRKRLNEAGTVTLGEKVKRKLEKRAALVARRVRIKQSCDTRARSTLTALNALQGEELLEVARRAVSLYRGNADELRRVTLSQDPLDRALEFSRRLSFGFPPEIYALQRSPALQEQLSAWLKKVERAAIRAQRIEASIRRKKNRSQKLTSQYVNRSDIPVSLLEADADLGFMRDNTSLPRAYPKRLWAGRRYAPMKSSSSWSENGFFKTEEEVINANRCLGFF